MHVGGYKVLVNAFKKFTQAIAAFKSSNGILLNTQNYIDGADIERTGKGIKIRKFIKATARAAEPKGSIDKAAGDKLIASYATR